MEYGAVGTDMEDTDTAVMDTEVMEATATRTMGIAGWTTKWTTFTALTAGFAMTCTTEITGMTTRIGTIPTVTIAGWITGIIATITVVPDWVAAEGMLLLAAQDTPWADGEGFRDALNTAAFSF